MRGFAGFLGAVGRQRSHAHLPEPNYVTRIMVLQAKVTDLRPVWLALGLKPLAVTRDIRASRVEVRDTLAFEIHEDMVARQRDDHGLPFAGWFIRNRR